MCVCVLGLVQTPGLVSNLPPKHKCGIAHPLPKPSLFYLIHGGQSQKKSSEQFSQGFHLLAAPKQQQCLAIACMVLLLLVWALFLLCRWEVVLGLHGKGFVAGGAAGLVSVRRVQKKLPLVREEPLPAGSKRDMLLTKLSQ